MPEGEKGILDDLLRCRRIPEDPVCQAERLSAVSVIQLDECLLIALRNGLQERGLVSARHYQLFSPS